MTFSTHLVLVLTYQCPSNCSYCHVLKNTRFIDKPVAFKAIDLYLKFAADFKGCIDIFGGEPLVRKPYLREIVQYIRSKDKEIEITLSTSGVLLDKETSGWLNSNNVKLLISLDGRKESHLLNRNITADSYGKLINNIKNNKSNTILNMVVAPNTVRDLITNFNFLLSLGITGFNILPTAYRPWNKRDLRILEMQLNLLALRLRNRKGLYLENQPTYSESPYFYTYFFKNGIVVDCNGDLFLSDAFMIRQLHNERKKLCVGNITQINSFKGLLLKQNQVYGKNRRALQKAFGKTITDTNLKIDSMLSSFVEELNNPPDRRVDIKVGYQCNNQCLFCVQGEKRKNCEFRETEVIFKNLEEAKTNCNAVVFTGGEPALHPDFLKFVSHAKKLGFKTIQVQTNGRMFAYNTFCKETINAGANEFSPALHGHIPQVHDYLTKSKGSFSQTVEGIRNLKKLKQRVITNTVVTKINYPYLPEIARLLVALDVDQFQFAFVHIVGSAWENRDLIVPKKSETIPFVKFGLDIGIRAGKRVMTEAIPFCLLSGFEKHVAERVIPDSMVFENKFRIPDYADYRVKLAKVKGTRCKACFYYTVCEGPWKEYPKLFGWKEFKPVTIN